MTEIKQNQKRVAVTCILAILLLFLYVFIFFFSSQDGNESGNLSYKVTEQVVITVGKVTGGFSDELVKHLTSIFEVPVRKTGHFTEYLLVGTLIYSIVTMWMKPSGKRKFLMLGWLVASAAFDEIHQLFVAGRAARLYDVGIDTLGGLAGFGICLLVLKLIRKIRQKSLKNTEDSADIIIK